MEIRKLNSLRGLAALIVFFTHFSDITNWFGGVFGGGSGGIRCDAVFLGWMLLLKHPIENLSYIHYMYK